MSLTINYPYEIPGNYAFDIAKIGVAGGKAALKPVDKLGEVFEQNFTSDAGFTYDAAKVEFVGGKVRQKDQRPVGATFGANYDSDIDGNWGDGILAGTAFGGAAVSGGELDLAHDDLRYTDYDAVDNADSQQTGAVRHIVKPNWSGVPSTWQVFWCITKAHNDIKNQLYVTQDDAGQLWLFIHDQNGVAYNAIFGNWNPVSGQEYEFELNWDIDAGVGHGEQRLFIDGVQFGSTKTITTTRSSEIGLLRIGSLAIGSATANFSFDDLIVFDSVQHVANYTPGYTVADYSYLESKVQLPQFTYPGIGAIQAFTDFSTVEDGITCEIWNDLWFDGTWKASDGSYAQANTKAEILANIATFPASDTLDIDVVFQESNSVQSEINNLIVTYTGQIYPVDNPIIEPNAPIATDNMVSFSATLTAAGNDDVRFVIDVDGTNRYWNGSGWADSLGYAQSNEAVDINANAGSLVSRGSLITPIAYLHSDDGSTTPGLDNLEISYDYFLPPDPEPKTCIVAGYLRDPSKRLLFNTKVRATLLTEGFLDGKNYWISSRTITAVSDKNGYFEIELIRSSEYRVATKQRFVIEISASEKYTVGDFTIPDLDGVDFDKL